MDLRQLEYIVQIAEENNITRAAEKLYITQSALNQQLLKLEKELGVPLFHRSRTDWHPTEAGEIYLSAARKMLQMKKDTYYRIHDLAEIQKDSFPLDLLPGRGIIMFSHIYPRFHRMYPDITVIPRGAQCTETAVASSVRQPGSGLCHLNAFPAEGFSYT